MRRQQRHISRQMLLDEAIVGYLELFRLQVFLESPVHRDTGKVSNCCAVDEGAGPLVSPAISVMFIHTPYITYSVHHNIDSHSDST